MFGTQHLPLFVLSCVMISLLPGPATMYIVGRSVAQGRWAGVLSVLGISTGSLCHTAAVAFGLSAVLAASQTAFLVVRDLGAAYLIFLGIQTLRAKAGPHAPDAGTAAVPIGRRVYAQGLMTQVLNPKASLFFLAILPQFVTGRAAHGPAPFLFLGTLFVCQDTLWYLMVACSSALLTGWLRRSARVQDALRWAAGTLYIALGLNLLRLRARTTS